MKIDDEILKKIRQCGLLQFDIDYISDLLGIDTSELVAEMQNKDSEVRKNYVKGRKEALLIVRKLLFTKVQDGDLSAIKQFIDLIDEVNRTCPI